MISRLAVMLVSLLAASVPPSAAAAQLPDRQLATGGEVTVPLPTYTRLLEQTRTDKRTAPAQYALGVSEVTVVLAEVAERTVARVAVRVRITTLENQWTSVPILPADVALSGAFIDGLPVELVHGRDGLTWNTERAATVSLDLRYSVDARRFDTGFSLSLPVPRAASTVLVVQAQAQGEVSVVPAIDMRKQSTPDGKTTYRATVPSTSAITLSWTAATARPHVVSRAEYRGELVNDALQWRAFYDVELFDAQATFAVMPRSVTLGDVRIDGEPATVLIEQNNFATVLRGRGRHRLEVQFEVPVTQGQGPPHVDFDIPEVPVSRFILKLPGKKAVKVTPLANVSVEESAQSTTASWFIPLSAHVGFSWVDAIPEEIRAELRANATTYHMFFADEGVLHARALVVYDISRGETNQLTLEVADSVLVNRISSPDGGLSDWVENRSEQSGKKRIQVFLERAVKGKYTLDVSYERLLGAAQSDTTIAVPLIGVGEVSRQRGMVALLVGQELALEPAREERLNRVGENQLPAFVRAALPMTVAHTYKYTASDPALTVRTKAPERVQGKFDAQVDTLVSLGEVTLKGSTTVEVNVKSGAIMALTLALPADVNVLGVGGPSLRSHRAQLEQDRQLIQIEFTQEMEGQFPIELNYELIMADATEQARVPTVRVHGAEVERGRIAVEALAAVQVTAGQTQQLSSLDLNELPQQLVLKTTNPILLAFKYVQAEPPPSLVLNVTRHSEIDVQVAAIESASYSTLMTRDGLSVTTARFSVRNSRRQFLKLVLPEQSEVWSVFTNGEAEKPARADSQQGGIAVLIRLINSVSGFPVEIVYATRGTGMAFSGTVRGQLPTPDMVVTKTTWNVYMPVGPRYHNARSNLDIKLAGQPTRDVNMRVAAAQDARSAVGAPLRIEVPEQGVQFRFEKLYANQSVERPYFELPYVSKQGNRVGLVLSVIGVLLLWSAIVALMRTAKPANTSLSLIVFAIGLALLLAGILYFGADPQPASILAIAIALVLASIWLIKRAASWWVGRRA